MCEFEQLYFDNDGYVVRCKDCGHYQVAYASMALTFSVNDFKVFCSKVKRKSLEMDCSLAEHSKSIVITTPCKNITMLLTRKEAMRFAAILDEAENEAMALSLINMFNS
jgi:ribosomal protein S27E